MSGSYGILLRKFSSFQYFEKRTQLLEEEHTKRNQPEQDDSSNVCPKVVEVPETDTSPAETLNILQGARTNEEAVNWGAVDFGERSGHSDDEVSVSGYSAEKLRSFNGSEKDRLGDLKEESGTRFLCEGESQVRIARVSANIGEVADVSRVSHAVQILTPVKFVDEVGRIARSMEVTAIGSHVKRISSVAFDVVEIFGGLVGILRPAIFRKLNLVSRLKTITSARCVTTEIVLSEIDPMAREGASVGQVGPSWFPVESVNAEMSPREKLIAQKNFRIVQRSNPSKLQRPYWKICFELNPPSVVDLWHTTTGLSADQSIQFARAIDLDVTLVS